jgi:hypothetical protein
MQVLSTYNPPALPALYVERHTSIDPAVLRAVHSNRFELFKRMVQASKTRAAQLLVMHRGQLIYSKSDRL